MKHLWSPTAFAGIIKFSHNKIISNEGAEVIGDGYRDEEATVIEFTDGTAVAIAIHFKEWEDDTEGPNHLFWIGVSL